MRNTDQHPVSDREKRQVLDDAIALYESFQLLGDIRPLALRQMRDQLFPPEKPQ